MHLYNIIVLSYSCTDVMVLYRPSTPSLKIVTILAKWMEIPTPELQSACVQMKWYNSYVDNIVKPL